MRMTVGGFAVLAKAFGKLSEVQYNKIDALVNIFDAQKITYNAAAYMLATAWHETGRKMLPIHELGQPRYFDKYEPGTKLGNELGNTEVGDGYLYRGRGYVQITGRANYAKITKRFGVDYIRSPDHALWTEDATRIMILGMAEGWFTGRKLSDYVTGTKKDYVNARRVINGQDKADVIAGYAIVFEKALRSL